jgi:hypothetical protein
MIGKKEKERAKEGNGRNRQREELLERKNKKVGAN